MSVRAIETSVGIYSAAHFLTRAHANISTNKISGCYGMVTDHLELNAKTLCGFLEYLERSRTALD
jgi:hypothetical protein